MAAETMRLSTHSEISWKANTLRFKLASSQGARFLVMKGKIRYCMIGQSSNLLKSITDIDLRERVRMILSNQAEFRNVTSHAKKKGIPVAPRRREDVDFSLLNMDSRNIENNILSPDPESNIELFVTEKTVSHNMMNIVLQFHIYSFHGLGGKKLLIY